MELKFGGKNIKVDAAKVEYCPICGEPLQKTLEGTMTMVSGEVKTTNPREVIAVNCISNRCIEWTK